MLVAKLPMFWSELLRACASRDASARLSAVGLSKLVLTAGDTAGAYNELFGGHDLCVTSRMVRLGFHRQLPILDIS